MQKWVNSVGFAYMPKIVQMGGSVARGHIMMSEVDVNLLVWGGSARRSSANPIAVGGTWMCPLSGGLPRWR